MAGTILDPEIQNFIKNHASSDVASLALKKAPQPDWAYPAILEQIKSRQKIAKKQIIKKSWFTKGNKFT